MNRTARQTQDRTSQSSAVRRFGKHVWYLLAGFPITLISFPVLVIMTTVSVATLVVWLGALLLPLTLLFASSLAALSKRRLEALGASVEPVTYRRYASGVFGKLRIISDPRRWLDLAFEGLLAFPLRLVTFALTLSWTLIGIGGVTYFFWSIYLPGDRTVMQLLQLAEPALIPDGAVLQYLLDVGAHFVIGIVFLGTLAPVVAGLAKLDATLTAALLGTKRFQTAPEATDISPERSFSITAWSRAGAGVAATTLLAVGWPVLAVFYSVGILDAMIWVTLHCAAILFSLRWAWAGMGLSLIASGALIALTADAGVAVWPWPVTVLLTQCAVFIVVGFVKPWYYAISGWSASVLVTLGVMFAVAQDIPAGALGNSIVFASVSAGTVASATLGRMWIRNAGRLQAAERTSALQDRRSKELAERNRIARELHDVVAHSMSVISVQAATARYRNPDIGETAQREFEEIASSSRQALSEMRMLLSILRNDDEAPTAPTPNLKDIDALVDATRASGTVIHYRGLEQTHDGLLGNTAPATALAAYRTVQEALSNALRHAPGTEVDVNVTLASTDEHTHWLHIAVINGPPKVQNVSSAGSGLGLTGIHERTAAVGGSSETKPTSTGGFAVYARLPLQAQAIPR
ncbi:MAG: sensor domain-containing protein [Yaniella sp.]|nr:sensor domain-containing protein [Yaniella sp.]